MTVADTLTPEKIDELVELAKTLKPPIRPFTVPCGGCGDEGPWYVVCNDGFVDQYSIALRDTVFLCGRCLAEKMGVSL